MLKVALWVFTVLTTMSLSAPVIAQKSGKGASLSGCLVSHEATVGKYPLGSIENTCQFPIKFVYCLDNIVENVITVMGCSSRNYKVISIAARETIGAETDRGNAYYFACKSPGVPTKVDFVKSLGIKAVCSEVEDSTVKRRETTDSTAKKRETPTGNKIQHMQADSKLCNVREEILSRMIQEDMPIQIKNKSASPEADARKNALGHFEELDYRISESQKRGESLDRMIALLRSYDQNEFARQRTQGYVEIIECRLKNGSLKRW